MAAKNIINAIGRRKTATARVYMSPVEDGGESGQIVINGRAFDSYFENANKRNVVRQPLTATEKTETYNFKVRVVGGGKNGQAGAVRHALARALEKAEPELRPTLKAAGLLTRDPRAVERKKAGRHKARKKPQFSKR